MDTASSSILEAIAELNSAFVATTSSALTASIDHLEGWTMRDLVGHVGGVYAYATANVAAASTDPTRPGEEARAPEGDALMAWFAERTSALLTALDEAPPVQRAWSHAGVQTGGWWRRRMLHETVVHLWDARAGAGSPETIEGELATDGVDEFFEVSADVNATHQRGPFPAQSLHLHRSDGPGEWMLQRGDSEFDLVITHEHGKGDAAVRGPASDLLLWIWGRPTNEIQIFGDENVAAAWQALAP